MSSAHNPTPTPQTPGSIGPVPVVAGPDQPNRKWMWGLLAMALAAACLYFYSNRPQDTGTSNIAQTRSATVLAGNVQRTLRLTGTTSAEKYVSLIAPSLRGSRSGGGSGGGSGGAGIGSVQSASVSSNAGGGSSSSATSSSFGAGSLASTSSASGDPGLTAASGGRSGASRTSAAPRSPSTKSGGGSRDNSAVVDDNLGSTGGALVGSGGPGGGGGGGRTGGGGPGGGGGGDFALLLQEAPKSGSPVTKGQKIAEFDRQYMLTRLDDYRASVVQSEMSFKKQQANLKVTREAHAQQILAAKNAMDKAELDMKTVPVRSFIETERLKLALEEAKAKYNQLLSEVKFVEISEKAQTRTSEIELEQSKIELKRAENNADKMIAKAPMNGVVVMMNTFRGSEFGYIQQGDQVYPGQMYMQVVDPSSMVINATVNQTDVEALKIGMRAKVRFDAYPGLELPARLVMIGALAKAGLSRYAYKKDIPVRLRLETIDARVIPDLSVACDVIISEEQAPAVVPLEAVFDGVAVKEATSNAETRETSVTKAFVFVKSGDVWLRREVQVGVRSYTHASIRSGLKPGEIIAAERPPDPGAKPAKET